MELRKAFDIQAASWSLSNGVMPFDPERDGIVPTDPKSLTWICLTVKDVEAARNALNQVFGFHPVAIEDALSDRERPGSYSDDRYVFATIPVIERQDDDVRYAHLGVFVCQQMLVTVTTFACAFVHEWFERWKLHPQEVGPTSDRLMYELIDAAVDDYFPALDDIQEEVDALEERVYTGSKLDVASAVRLRRRLLEMRRQVTPIRDVVNVLLRRDVVVIQNETRTYLQDVYDHALRVLEGVDLNRDILTSIMDAQLSVQSNRLNEVMKNMTSLATILMILALITGNYGMNFDNMPELHTKHGYFVVIGVMWVVFIGGLLVASKIGWLTVQWPWSRKKN